MPEITRRETIFSTEWFELVAKTVEGSAADGLYYALQPTDYVTVLALTAEQQFVLVRQYRPAVETYTLELPSGNVDKGENPEQATRRELVEETGYQPEKLEFLGCLKPDTGRLANRLWCYFAHVTPTPTAYTPEPGLELVLRSPAELLSDIEEGNLDHALHLAVISLAVLKKKLPPGLLQV